MLNNKGLSAFVVLLFLIIILGGGGYYGYKNYYLKQQQGRGVVKDLKYVTLREEILLFTYKKLPGIYTGLLSFNSEMTLIDQELERLTTMEGEFPQQLEIISAEKGIWQETRNTLSSTLTEIETEIEAMYVSYKVNIEKGRKRIKEKKEGVGNKINATIKTSNNQTSRLKEKKEVTAKKK